MPDTRSYYIVAYVIVAIFYAGYAVSLWMRLRKTRRREDGTTGS